MFILERSLQQMKQVSADYDFVGLGSQLLDACQVGNNTTWIPITIYNIGGIAFLEL